MSPAPPSSRLRRLEVIGHWFHPEAPDDLPLPQHLVGRWRAHERAAVLAWLRAGRVVARYPSASWCRFACGKRAMGSCDLTDGTFVWPEGLAHYVDEHDVRLPEHFVVHVLAQGDVTPTVRGIKPRFGLYDPAPWRAWARRLGACLDLRGWRAIDAVTRERLAALWRGVPPSTVVLVRRRPHEVVARRGDGTLEVWARGARKPSRRLRGWHEWPVRGRRGATSRPAR